MPDMLEQEPRSVVAGEDPVSFLDDYTRPFWRKSRFWLWVILLTLFAGLAWAFRFLEWEQEMTGAQLQTAVEVLPVSSAWVPLEPTGGGAEREIIVVPRYVFRIHNRGNRPLQHLFFLGVFRFLDTGRNIGEGYRMVLEKPLNPGETSQDIELTSALGYRAKSLQAFRENAANWRPAFVELFLRRRSQFLSLRSAHISHRILGTDVEIRVGTPPPSSGAGH